VSYELFSVFDDCRSVSRGSAFFMIIHVEIDLVSPWNKILYWYIGLSACGNDLVHRILVCAVSEVKMCFMTS